jgi:hypothetical protein
VIENGDFWRILEPVRQKSLCGVGVNKYFQGAGLMRECETKIFFWGCGLIPSLYGIHILHKQHTSLRAFSLLHLAKHIYLTACLVNASLGQAYRSFCMPCHCFN